MPNPQKKRIPPPLADFPDQFAHIARTRAREEGTDMNPTTDYTMPFGQNKGEPITTLDTPRLLWLLSRDQIRYQHPDFTRAGLALLQDRLGDIEALMAELVPLAPPPKRWTTKKQRRAQRQLQAMVEPIRQIRAQHLEIERGPVRGQIIDAFEFVRAKRNNLDGSDLV